MKLTVASAKGADGARLRTDSRPLARSLSAGVSSIGVFLFPLKLGAAGHLNV
jgi:hypothetical protein